MWDTKAAGRKKGKQERRTCHKKNFTNEEELSVALLNCLAAGVALFLGQKLHGLCLAQKAELL